MIHVDILHQALLFGNIPNPFRIQNSSCKQFHPHPHHHPGELVILVFAVIMNLIHSSLRLENNWNDPATQAGICSWVVMHYIEMQEFQYPLQV
jgi:hypothetical protein